jgi:hypothetical protein
MTSTYQTTMEDTTYNGWTNFETWNASLWIGNNEFLYNTAKACVKFCTVDDTPYDAFVRCMNNSERFATGDGVKWNDPLINYDEMNEMMNELAGD